MENSYQNSAEERCHTNLLSVKKFSQKHDWPIGGLRHLLFYKPHSFEKVIRRVGRKILIDEAAFFLWVEEINLIQNKPTKRGIKK